MSGSSYILSFSSGRAAVAQQCCTCARATMEGKWPHTHTESAVWISTALPRRLCHSCSASLLPPLQCFASLWTWTFFVSREIVFSDMQPQIIWGASLLWTWWMQFGSKITPLSLNLKIEHQQPTHCLNWLTLPFSPLCSLCVLNCRWVIQLRHNTNYASNMSDRIYIQNCAAPFSLLTQCSVDEFRIFFPFFSYNADSKSCLAGPLWWWPSGFPLCHPGAPPNCSVE